MKALSIGIATHEQMRARTIAIARGQLRPKATDPKVWFNSVESFAKVLSAKNRELLAVIAKEQPKSITELETLTGRAKSNLSRTLHKMEHYGLVELKKGKGGTIVPRTPYGSVKLSLDLMAVGG